MCLRRDLTFWRLHGCGSGGVQRQKSRDPATASGGWGSRPSPDQEPAGVSRSLLETVGLTAGCCLPADRPPSQRFPRPAQWQREPKPEGEPRARVALRQPTEVDATPGGIPRRPPRGHRGRLEPTTREQARLVRTFLRPLACLWCISRRHAERASGVRRPMQAPRRGTPRVADPNRSSSHQHIEARLRWPLGSAVRCLNTGRAAARLACVTARALGLRPSKCVGGFVVSVARAVCVCFAGSAPWIWRNSGPARS